MRIVIKSTAQLNLLLEKYGRWKRDYITGLGFPSGTIESKIGSGEIFGDGCGKGGRKPGSTDPTFNGDEESSYINRCINQMKNTHPREMKVLDLVYVCDWSVKKIARDIGCSRYAIDQLLRRGKTLIEGWMIRF